MLDNNGKSIPLLSQRALEHILKLVNDYRILEDRYFKFPYSDRSDDKINCKRQMVKCRVQIDLILNEYKSNHIIEESYYKLIAP